MLSVSPGLSLVGMFLLLFSGGGFVGINGITPLPEDPVVSQIAPRECLFYTSWTGKKEAAPDSANATEQLFSDGKFQTYLKLIEKKIHDTIARNGDKEESARAFRLFKHLQTHAGAFYISEVTSHPGKMDGIRAGLVLRVDDDDKKPIVQAMDSLLLRIPHKIRTTVKIGDSDFTSLSVMDRAPTLTWGMSGNYFIVGVGHREAEQIVQRQQGQAPDWLVEAKRAVEIPRPASFLHLDIRRLVDAWCAFANPRDAAVIPGLLEAFGLDAIESLSLATGLDSEGSVSRGLVKLTGELRGVMTLLDCEPLAKTDFEQISSKSPFALVFQLSPADAVTAFLESCEHEMASKDARFMATELRQQISMLDEELGINLREDLLASIGDTWRVFAQPGPDALTKGWTISIDLADADKFTEVHEKLLGAFRENLEAMGGPVKIITEQQEKTRFHTIHLPGMPTAPSWCIHEDRLLVCSSADSVKRLLLSPATTLAEAEHIRPLLEEKARPFKLIHVDEKAIAQFALPLIARRLGVLPQGTGINASLLPPLDILTRHLKSSAIAVRRTEEGVEFIRRGTWPGTDFGQAIPLIAGGTLPAVGNAHAAAQEVAAINNQKQIALALHHFRSAMGAFPAGYSADKNGKPLLSWRVHILPYLESYNLHSRFHLDEPWDSEHNKKLIGLMPDVFRAPHSKAEAGKTTYLGVGGADGIFVRPQPGSLTGIGMKHVTDGTSNTVMTVELTDKRAIIWTKPGDFAPKKDDPKQGLHVDPRRGMSLGFADGSVRPAPKNTPNATMKAYFTKAGGEVIKRP